MWTEHTVDSDSKRDATVQIIQPRPTNSPAYTFLLTPATMSSTHSSTVRRAAKRRRRFIRVRTRSPQFTLPTTTTTTHVPTINKEEEEEKDTNNHPRKRFKQQSQAAYQNVSFGGSQADFTRTAAAAVSIYSSLAYPISSAMTPTAMEITIAPRHVASPIEWCDANSLSVIFSFLKSREFSSALRVSHFWHSIGRMNTAWPEFNLSDYIQQLENENYSGAGHRRLTLRTSKELTDALNHPIKKKANDIILGDQGHTPTLPSRLSEFNHLTALNVTLTGEVDVDTAEFTRDVRDRLLVLIVGSPWTHLRVFSTLHELSALRVLVTDFPIQSSPLEQLTRLEYLHVGHSYFFQPELIRSVRLLSVYHSLRHFSLEWDYDDGDYFIQKITSQVWIDIESEGPDYQRMVPPKFDSLEELTNEWNRPIGGGDESKVESVPVARLIHFGVVGLELYSTKLLTSILSIEGLQRLTLETSTRGIFWPLVLDEDVSNSLSRIRELRLFISENTTWEIPELTGVPSLDACTALRSLHLSLGTKEEKYGVVSRRDQPRVICELGLHTSYWPQFEELSVTYPLRLDSASIQGLAACTHLRRLDLSNRPICDLNTLASVLAGLPEFQILEVTIWPPESKTYTYRGEFFDGIICIPAAPPFVIPKHFMQYVSRSTTWFSLHLHLSDDHIYPMYRGQPKKPWSIDESQLTLRAGIVDLVTAKRFRLHTHSESDDAERMYRVVTNPMSLHQSWEEM